MTNPQTAPDTPDLGDGGRLVASAWGWRDIGGVLVLTVVILALLVTTESLVASVAGIRSGHPGRLLGLGLFATFAFELCLLALAFGFSVGKYGLPWSDFGFASFPSWGWALPVFGILGSYLIIGIYLGLVSALHLHGLLPTSNVPSGLFDSPELVPFAGFEICLVAPLAEESFFRGFLFHGLLGKWLALPGSSLRQRLGFFAAALPTGLLFAAFHAQLGLLIPFTCVGVLFAWIFWRSGSLWPNIMTHAGFNLINFAASLAAHHH
jgi:membrane protease YdiL (CAAX protease family)